MLLLLLMVIIPSHLKLRITCSKTAPARIIILPKMVVLGFYFC